MSSIQILMVEFAWSSTCFLSFVLVRSLMGAGWRHSQAEAEFLDEIQTKVFALKFLFLQTHATSDSFLEVSYCKGERRKIW